MTADKKKMTNLTTTAIRFVLTTAISFVLQAMSAPSTPTPQYALSQPPY
jgi:hypothetical protein